MRQGKGPNDSVTDNMRHYPQQENFVVLTQWRVLVGTKILVFREQIFKLEI